MTKSLAIVAASVIGIAIGSGVTYGLTAIPDSSQPQWLARASKDELITRLGQREYQISQLETQIAADVATHNADQAESDRLHGLIVDEAKKYAANDLAVTKANLEDAKGVLFFTKMALDEMTPPKGCIITDAEYKALHDNGYEVVRVHEPVGTSR